MVAVAGNHQWQCYDVVADCCGYHCLQRTYCCYRRLAVGNRVCWRDPTKCYDVKRRIDKVTALWHNAHC